ncbi:MAG: TlpA family protein disulfide reductase [Elusimicrobia bacterium]|nr:TlpA family protein disulfide reductase [Elusimicrobiota bacterium]
MKKILLLSILALSLGACTSPMPAGGGFKLPNINGTTFDSAVDAKNQPVFIAFMATYCGYCKMSVPQVVEVQKTYGPKGLKVIGIFANDTKDEPAEYAKTYGVTYDVLYNGSDVAQQFDVNGVPHFVLLDKNHNIVKTWSGYSPVHNFAAEINKVL